MRISDWSSDVCSSDLTLPDIDALDVGADFTVFMREGVPNALKQRALRRLWQVDPAFRHICMLDDYNLDYTDAATVVPNLKTLFQVGRGLVLPGEDRLETRSVWRECVRPFRSRWSRDHYKQ